MTTRERKHNIAFTCSVSLHIWERNGVVVFSTPFFLCRKPKGVLCICVSVMYVRNAGHCTFYLFYFSNFISKQLSITSSNSRTHQLHFQNDDLIRKNSFSSFYLFHRSKRYIPPLYMTLYDKKHAHTNTRYAYCSQPLVT